jgi:hypothetical protein
MVAQRGAMSAGEGWTRGRASSRLGGDAPPDDRAQREDVEDGAIVACVDGVTARALTASRRAASAAARLLSSRPRRAYRRRAEQQAPSATSRASDGRSPHQEEAPSATSRASGNPRSTWARRRGRVLPCAPRFEVGRQRGNSRRHVRKTSPMRREKVDNLQTDRDQRRNGPPAIPLVATPVSSQDRRRRTGHLFTERCAQFKTFGSFEEPASPSASPMGAAASESADPSASSRFRAALRSYSVRCFPGDSRSAARSHWCAASR